MHALTHLPHQLILRWPTRTEYQTLAWTLSEAAYREAIDGGWKRFHARIAAGSKEAVERAAIEELRKPEDQIIGCLGERAHAERKGLYWHWDWPPIGKDKLADFGDRDVKTHRTGSKLMFLLKRDHLEYLYIGATASIGSRIVVFRGWLPGVECKLTEYWRDPRAHLRKPGEVPRFCYCVPMAKLNKMSDLPGEQT